MSQAQQAYSAAAATYTAVAGMRAAAYGAAAAAQPVAGYAAVAGWVLKSRRLGVFECLSEWIP